MKYLNTIFFDRIKSLTLRIAKNNMVKVYIRRKFEKF
jgi:hypothetical protein